MEELELYDIITLNDENEYTILSKTEYLGKKYYLIAPIDSEETPDIEELRIVEEIKKDGEITLEEETDVSKLEFISNEFLKLLKKDLKD